MSVQADGTILIDTTISEDGFKAGSKDIELAAKRMAKTVGDIGDKSKIALQKQLDSFSKVNAQYAAQEKRVEALKKKIEEFNSQKIPTEEYAEIQKQIAETEKKLSALNERQEKFINTGGKTNSKAYARMQYDADQLVKTLEYATAEKQALENSGGAFKTGSNTAEAQKTAAQLETEQQKLADVNNRVNTSFMALKQKIQEYGGSLAAAKGETSDYGGTLDRVKQGFQSLGSGVKMLSGGILKTAAKGIKNIASLAAKASVSLGKLVGKPILNGLVKMTAGMFGIHKSANKTTLSLKNLVKYGLGIRTLYALFGKMRSAVAEGFKNLAQYSGSTNKDISSLMSSMTQLKNSFATAFAPILS
jgi:anti-sigma28 factor (negative regulator of flagellin synthesis)